MSIKPAGLGTASIYLMAFLMATALSWLIPPIQSPDEGSHLARAYLISKGQLGMDAPSPELRELAVKYGAIPGVSAFIERTLQHPGGVGGQVDDGLMRYIEAYMALPGITTRLPNELEQQGLAQLRWSGSERVHVFPGTGYYVPLVYAPQAAGLAMGQLLDLSIEHSYRLSRAVTLAACLALLWLAFRLISPSPAVLAILLLPMSLFQMLSPTIDGLTTSLAVLAISLFLAMADRRNPDSVAQSLGLAACVALLGMSRNHLMPLLLLPFFIAWQQRSRRDLVLGCLALVAMLAWTWYALHTVNDQRILRSQPASDLILHYVTHPLALLQVMLATVFNAQLVTFYQQSFIGILGALDAPLRTIFYPVLWAALALCTALSVSGAAWREDQAARMVLLLAAVASAGLVFVALLVTWTPHPAEVVQGVQGRYFVVPALLLAFALRGFATEPGRRRRLVNLLATAGFAGLSVVALVTALLARYHPPA